MVWLCFASSLATASASSTTQTVRLPVVAGGDIRFAHISRGIGTEEGISRARVEQTAQDDQGFIWFATTRGLYRYDSYRFRLFRHDPQNPGSLSGNYLRTMFKDRSGNLWIACDEFADRYDSARETFTHFHLPSPAWDFSQDREGMLWIGTTAGLIRLDPSSGQMVRFEHRQDDQTSLGSNLVTATFEQKDGTFWVANRAGIDVFDRRTGKVIQHFQVGPEPDAQVYGFLEDHAGVLWVAYGFWNGLATIDRKAGKVTGYSFFDGPAGNPRTSGVHAIREDERGAIWLATDSRGLFRLDRDRKQVVRYRDEPSDRDSLGASGLVSLFEDREGNMWVGTAGNGADRFSPVPTPFRTIRHEPGNSNSLRGNYVTAAYPDSYGALWIATNDVLNKLDRKTGKFTFYIDHLFSSTYVTAIAEDRTGALWFGTLQDGLNRMDPRTGRVKTYRNNPADPHSLGDNHVSSFLIDRAGTLWVGTVDTINAFDPAADSFRVYRPGVVGIGGYRGLTQDSDGTIWAATTLDGLHRLDPKTGKFFIYRHDPRQPRSLSSNQVMELCLDHNGNLWVATDSGLERFDRPTGTFKVWHESDGLPNDSVTSVLEAPGGELWISTENGLSRFNPSTGTFRNYYDSDGLLQNEFIAYNTAAKSADGEMFFCSSNGVTSFFPQQVIDKPDAPPLRLTDFRLFDRPVPIGDGSPLAQSILLARSLRLAHDQNLFSLEFSALSYRSPDRTRYRYKLEPLNREWIETDSTRRSVTFTPLAAGKYVFRIQARTSRGMWGENEAATQILILPPWWGTWWFRSAFALGILGLLWTLYRYRLHKLAHEFDLRLEERLRIARDLHDTLLQSFHGLLPRFQAVVNLLPGRAGEARQMLEGALDDAARAVTEARDTVQGMRSATVLTSNLTVAIEGMGHQLRERESASNGATPTFSVDVEGATRELHPILRDEVCRIAGEALRNAFHHAQAGRIEVEIRYDPRRFRLRVRDDGIGIDSSIVSQGGLPGHWGLRGMRERAKAAGGHLEVWTEKGAGTEVELTIPGALAYAADERRRFRLFQPRPGPDV